MLTFVFLVVIMGATDGRAPAGFAPIAIGLCLTLIHLISIPIDNTSVNPARSTGVALFAGRLGDLAVVAVLGRADRPAVHSAASPIIGLADRNPISSVTPSIAEA